MEMDIGVLLEPALILLVGVEIVEDDVELAAREGSNDAVHEAEELDTAAALGMRRDDPSGGDFERCEQGRGAVPLVVMAVATQSASVRQLQIALRPLQGLDRRLLIDTENDRLGRRIDVKAHHVGSLGGERRVIALAPGFAPRKVDLVLAQEAPDVLNINVAQGLGQQRTVPAAIALRRRLIQKRQDAFVRGFAVDRLLAPVRQVLQSAKAMIGKAPAPVADNPGLNPHFLGDRTRAAALSRKQHYPRTLHVALRRARCPAARLKHFAYLRLEPNLSCFGNHPDLES